MTRQWPPAWLGWACAHRRVILLRSAVDGPVMCESCGQQWLTAERWLIRHGVVFE